MASTGAARAGTFPSNAVVTVSYGVPCPEEVYVNLHGTVQFVNKDSIDYRVRLKTREGHGHADVDILLPGRGGFTLIVDPGTVTTGKCEYELFGTNLLEFVRFATAVSDAPDAMAETGHTAEALTASSLAVAPPPPPPPPPSPTAGSGSAMASRAGGGTIKVG